MNKLWLIGICMVLLIGSVLGAAPTTPTTLSPANKSSYVSTNPLLICSGSTDADADSIFYEFWCKEQGHYKNWQSGEPNADGDCVIVDVSAGFKWADKNCSDAGSYNALCENGTDYNLSSVKTNWSSGKVYCEENITGDFRYVSIDSAAEQTYLETTFPANHWWIGLNDVETEGTFVWDNISYSLMQNTSATTYTWDVGNGSIGNWKCRAIDSNDDTSSYTSERTIYEIDFYNCSLGSSGAVFNFTGWDEESRELLTNMSLDIYINFTDSIDGTSLSFELGDDNNYTMCLSPYGISLDAEGFAEYTSNDSYSYPRQYHFDGIPLIGGTLQDIKLYLLSDTYSDAVTFTASRNGLGVEDIIIHIQRWDPGSGIYSVVAMGKTDSNGQDIIYLRLTDAWYYVTGWESGVSVYDPGSAEHLISAAYSMYLGGGEGGYPSDPEEWFKFGTIAYNLTWNASGNENIRLVTDDSTGATTTQCLKVDKYKDGDRKQLYYACDTSAAVIITYNITDLNANYVAKFIVYKDDLWQEVYGIGINLYEGLSGLIGLDGPVYAFFFIGIIAFIGLFSPAVAILMAMVGMVLAFAIGFVSVAWYSVIALILVGIILIIKTKQ